MTKNTCAISTNALGICAHSNHPSSSAYGRLLAHHPPGINLVADFLMAFRPGTRSTTPQTAVSAESETLSPNRSPSGKTKPGVAAGMIRMKDGQKVKLNPRQSSRHNRISPDYLADRSGYLRRVAGDWTFWYQGCIVEEALGSIPAT